MREELDKMLCEKYPEIFADRRGDMRKTLMCWGFDVGDGWFNIINQACRLIQWHIDQSRKNTHMINQRRDDCLPIFEWMENHEEVPQVTAVQVKEKFGTLRFYVDYEDDYTQGVLAMAEAMSAVTCEICGNPGELRGGGWLCTLCDEHAEDKPAHDERSETHGCTDGRARD